MFVFRRLRHTLTHAYRTVTTCFDSPGVWFEDVLKAARWFRAARARENGAHSAETKDIQKLKTGMRLTDV